MDMKTITMRTIEGVVAFRAIRGEETCARIEREHTTTAEMMLSAYNNVDTNDVSFRSIGSFLYRMSTKHP